MSLADFRLLVFLLLALVLVLVLLLLLVVVVVLVLVLVLRGKMRKRLIMSLADFRLAASLRLECGHQWCHHQSQRRRSSHSKCVGLIPVV